MFHQTRTIYSPPMTAVFCFFFCFYSTNHIPPWLQATTEWNIVISFDNTAEVPSIPITERPDQVDHKCFNVKTESNWKMASSCLIIRADKAPGPGSLHASFSLWELQVEALSTGKKTTHFLTHLGHSFSIWNTFRLGFPSSLSLWELGNHALFLSNIFILTVAFWETVFWTVHFLRLFNRQKAYCTCKFRQFVFNYVFQPIFTFS